MLFFFKKHPPHPFFFFFFLPMILSNIKATFLEKNSHIFTSVGTLGEVCSQSKHPTLAQALGGHLLQECLAPRGFYSTLMYQPAACI
jgi:hypothetical protein